jgi:hypothetical protein
VKTPTGTHEGRVALVTGAGQGIGQAIAVALAKCEILPARDEKEEVGPLRRHRTFFRKMRENGLPRSSNMIGLAIPGMSHYIATKMGIIGFTTCWPMDAVGNRMRRRA